MEFSKSLLSTNGKTILKMCKYAKTKQKTEIKIKKIFFPKDDLVKPSSLPGKSLWE